MPRHSEELEALRVDIGLPNKYQAHSNVTELKITSVIIVACWVFINYLF